MSRVLVTGGASGLGAALVARFVADGHQVLSTDVAAESPAPDGAQYRQLNVREAADWDKAVAWCEENWGGLDILVNNAGIATGGRIEVESLDEWDRVVDINLMGVVRGCRAFTPVFKKQRSGHIVNTASAAGLVHPPMMSSYNTVKAGVVALSETLSHELHPYGVSVSVVCPSFFRTNLADSIKGDDTEMGATARRLIEKSPRTADEIAANVLMRREEATVPDHPRPPRPDGLAHQTLRPPPLRPPNAQGSHPSPRPRRGSQAGRGCCRRPLVAGRPNRRRRRKTGPRRRRFQCSCS